MSFSNRSSQMLKGILFWLYSCSTEPEALYGYTLSLELEKSVLIKFLKDHLSFVT